jgi:hypothetical protein
MGLRGGQGFQLPWLIPQINRDDHFLLTETLKSIYRGGQCNITALINAYLSRWIL